MENRPGVVISTTFEERRSMSEPILASSVASCEACGWRGRDYAGVFHEIADRARSEARQHAAVCGKLKGNDE